jgi:hypothetical protein
VMTGSVVLYSEDSIRALLEILWLLALAIATRVCTAAPYTGLTWSLVAFESGSVLAKTLILLRLYLPHV